MSGKEQIYEKSKLGGQIGFGKRPAVVVIDLQKGFTLPEFPAGGDMTDTVAAANKVTKAARAKNVKVFHTRVAYNGDGTDLGPFGHKAFVLRDFVRGSDSCEFDDRLVIEDSDIVYEKHWPSVFFGTHLVQMLIAAQVDTLIVLGCTTAGCVYASVVDSCSYGFRTVVASDGVTDRSEETHNMFLWNMGQKYADILTVDEIDAKFGELETLEYDLHW